MQSFHRPRLERAFANNASLFLAVVARVGVAGGVPAATGGRVPLFAYRARRLRAGLGLAFAFAFAFRRRTFLFLRKRRFRRPDGQTLAQAAHDFPRTEHSSF